MSEPSYLITFLNSVPVVLTVGMYLLSGLHKLYKPEAEAARFVGRINSLINVDMSKSKSTKLMILAGIVETAASALLILESIFDFDMKHVRLSSALLAIFTIIVTVIFFFPFTGSNYYPFISNVTALGALLALPEYIQSRMRK